MVLNSSAKGKYPKKIIMENNKPIEIICCIALHDVKVYDHLLPIAKHPLISKIWVIRVEEQKHKEIPGVEYVVIPHKFKIIRLIDMLLTSISLGKRPEIKAFISFNPIPYGLIAFIAAKLNKKPVHLGFIGSDWNIHCKGLFGGIYKALFRHADFITTTGSNMKKEMVSEGFRKDKIAILPHSIDLNHFKLTTTNEKKYAGIFIGNLIPLKNIDIILSAFKLVLKKYPEKHFCIIGDGPLMNKLKDQLKRFPLTDNIEFTGQVKNVQPYIENSRSVIIASTTEGFPFVLVEAICSGVIPISTPVGTIPEILTDNENALFFKTGDPDELAEKIILLIENNNLYNKLKENVIALRENFSFQSATDTWDPWLKKFH